MTVLFTSDLHLTDNPRDMYRHDWCVGELRKLVKDAKADTVVIIGDLTEAKDRHSAWLTNAVANVVHELSKLASVLIVKGNHDGTDADVPFFAFLDYIENVRYVVHPTTYEYRDMGTWLLLPHTREYKSDWNMKLSGHDLIVAHATFNGATAGGWTSEDGIPLSYFPKCRIIAGDVHHPQDVKHQQTIATYCGAPYLVDFGDDYTPRVLVMQNNGKLYSVNCTGPQKRLVDITDLAQLDDLAKGVKSHDIIKVRVHLANDQRAKWAQIQDDVKHWADTCGYNLHATLPVVSDKSRLRTPTKIKSAVDDVQLVEAYGKHRSFDELTIKTGVKLMKVSHVSQA